MGGRGAGWGGAVLQQVRQGGALPGYFVVKEVVRVCLAPGPGLAAFVPGSPATRFKALAGLLNQQARTPAAPYLRPGQCRPAQVGRLDSGWTCRALATTSATLLAHGRRRHCS
jgi:hypothetical protein